MKGADRGAAIPAQSGRDLMAELEALRAETRAQNPELTAEQAEHVAGRVTRDAIDALVESGFISFEREQADW